MYSHTIAVLEKFDNQHDFERMSADILNALGYKDVVLIAPRGGSDGGRDITFTTENEGKGLACVTLRKDSDKKFDEDFSQRSKGDFDKYFFFTNQYLTADQKKKYAHFCLDQLDAELVPQDIEAIRSLLDNPLKAIRDTYLFIKAETRQVAFIEANKLRREDFNLGDNSAAYFTYITQPIQQAYETATQLLSDVSIGKKITKQGILVLGEANAGKTRLALEALIATLPDWLVLTWRPGYTSHDIPASLSQPQRNIAIFVDDLQLYAPSINPQTIRLDFSDININTFLHNKAETLQILLSKVRTNTEQFIVIATCREENEKQVQVCLGSLFESLKLIRIPHFNTDPSSSEAAQVINEFERQGAEHKRDWDGNLGSLVLGLSRKRNIYTDLVMASNPGIFILRAMKLLTLAGTEIHTTNRLQAICSEVFGIKELQLEVRIWRFAVEALKKVQFIQVNQDSFHTTLVIRKDIYFEEVINDYSEDDAEQDFRLLQKALVALKDSEALTDMSSVYIQRKWHQDIISLANNTLAFDPENVLLWVLKGRTYISRGGPYLPEEALAAFNHALKIDDEDPFIFYHRGIAHMNLGHHQEALNDFNTSINLDPDNIEVQVLKGRALEEMKRYQEALNVFNQLLDVDPTNPEIWYEKAHTLKNLNQPEEALLAFEKALDIDPQHVNVWYSKAALLRTLERWEDALAAFNRVLELTPDDSDALHGKGNVCLMLDKHEEGLTALERALTFDGENIHILFDKGLALAGQHRYKEAALVLKRVSDLDPTYDNNIEYIKGASLRLSGQYEEALEALGKALERNPENVEAWFDKSLVYGVLEQYDNALKALECALAIDPNFAHIWYFKGMVLRESGKETDALSAFIRAKSLSLDDDDIFRR